MISRGRDCNSRRRQEPLHGGKEPKKDQRRRRGRMREASGEAKCRDQGSGSKIEESREASGGAKCWRGRRMEEEVSDEPQ